MISVVTPITNDSNIAKLRIFSDMIESKMYRSTGRKKVHRSNGIRIRLENLIEMKMNFLASISFLTTVSRILGPSPIPKMMESPEIKSV
jgi:hypothetical protein